MATQGRTIDAPGLVMTYTPRRRYQPDEMPIPSRLADVAVRILGAFLLLYQQQVPQRSYYEVQDISAQ
jgi:hypothetical protein